VGTYFSNLVEKKSLIVKKFLSAAKIAWTVFETENCFGGISGALTWCREDTVSVIKTGNRNSFVRRCSIVACPVPSTPRKSHIRPDWSGHGSGHRETNQTIFAKALQRGYN